MLTRVRRKKEGNLTGYLEGDEMSEGALTKDFDLVRGTWRINASRPGYKVVGCAIEGLRHRLFQLRKVGASEFSKQVPFDERGEPIELPVMLHGMPTWYYY